MNEDRASEKEVIERISYLEQQNDLTDQEYQQSEERQQEPQLEVQDSQTELKEEVDEYEIEELSNERLNQDLTKFSQDLRNIEEEQQKNQEQEQIIEHSEPSKRQGDKLAGLTLQQIVDLVNNNQHAKLCLNNYFCMGQNSTEGKCFGSDPVNGHYQFKKDWERDPKTGKFIFKNQEKINSQKKVISFILSKIGSNIISGKSVMNISLPIDIFEKRSNLERFAYSCSFAPHYLKRAGLSTDPLEQMKNAAVYIITSTIMYLNLEKPFNPILGETYQGRLDGFPFYSEQISHHPPICSYQYYTDTYLLNGSIESIAQMHANSVTGINQGNVYIKFLHTGNQIGLIQAPGSLNGTAIGTRYFTIDGRYIAYDLKNKLVCEIKINPKEKKGLFKSSTQPIDYFAGGIYKVTDKFVTKFKSLKPDFFKFTGLNMKDDVVEEVSVITGIWNQYILIDGVKWYDLESPLPYLLEHEINPLPSDCNYRQDLLYLKDGDKKLSQEYKEKLEVFQRGDKKLREKGYEIAKKLRKMNKNK